MSLQFKRGTDTANNDYTGLAGEISVDFTNEVLRVHDGDTAGGAFSVGTSGGTGSTDLSVNYATDSFTLTSSTGASATVAEASGDTAGALSSADKTKLDGIETGATTDQTGEEIKSAYEGNANTNAFTDAEQTKLSGIAAEAEVNRSISSTSEAEDLTNNTNVLTPLRLAEALAAGNWNVDFGVL